MSFYWTFNENKFIYRRLGEEYIIFNLETEKYCTLNELGNFIFKLLIEGKTVREIKPAVSQTYEIVDQKTVEQDIWGLIKRLQTKGIIHKANAHYSQTREIYDRRVLMAKKKTRVSVLMPAYNTALYIREAIESVLKQNYSSFELLIMDDGSTDETWNIIQDYSNDPRIRIFKRRHRGIAATRNELIRLCESQFIAMHDADDIMLQGRLKTQAQYLIKNKCVGVVFGNCLVFDEFKAPFLRKIRATMDTKNGQTLVPRIPNCAAMIRKTFLLKAGLYNPQYTIADDSDMWTRLSEITKFKYLKKYFYIYRIHKKSITQRMFPILENEDAALTQTTISRRSGKSLKRFKLFCHEVQLNICTNSNYIRKSARDILYLNHSNYKPTLRYDFELHKVPSILGIYPQIKFSEKKDSEIEIKNDGEALYWKSNQFQFISKMNRQEKKCFFYMSSTSSLGPDQLVEYAFLYPLIFLLRSQGWFFLHSAAIVGEKRVVLIAGPTLSGKTTLSLMLVKKEYKLMSDETNILFLRKGRIYVKGFPIKPKIKKINLPKFPELMKHQNQLLEIDNQKFFFPLSLLKENSRDTSSAPLSLIVYPEYCRHGKLKVSKISYSEWLRLLKETNHYSKFKMKLTETLNYILFSRLLYRRIPIYKCQYSEESVEELIAFIENS